MARGRGRGRGSAGRGGNPQADGIGGQNDTNQVQPLIPHITSMVQTSGDGSNQTTPELSPTAPNQINITTEGTSTLRNQIVYDSR
ncbi:hypothetical protein P3L10_016243 [Capsicum annuum]